MNPFPKKDNAPDTEKDPVHGEDEKGDLNRCVDGRECACPDVPESGHRKHQRHEQLGRHDHLKHPFAVRLRINDRQYRHESEEQEAPHRNHEPGVDFLFRTHVVRPP